MPEPRSFRIRHTGPVTIVESVTAVIVGRSLINVFSDELLEFVIAEKPEKLLVTLSDVVQFSSEAIGGLTRVVRRVNDYGGQMKLCMNRDLRELFKVTRLDGTLFDIHKTEEGAIEAFFRS